MTKPAEDILKSNKVEFLNQEIWLLTFGGAFQRAHIYNLGIEDIEKREFRSALSSYIEMLVRSYAYGNIDDGTHIQNINKISKFSNQFEQILKGGQINIGVSQKILNLYLKYQWCLGVIPEPPHFPVDRIIQQKLNSKARLLGIRPIKLVNWTEISDSGTYLEVIMHAKNILKDKTMSKYSSLAQLELELFERN